jgi:hypothetical protein
MRIVHTSPTPAPSNQMPLFLEGRGKEWEGEGKAMPTSNLHQRIGG